MISRSLKAANPTAVATALLLAAVLFCLPATRALAADAPEMVDNPRYTSWAKYKPGTKVTMSQDMNSGPVNMTNSLVQTLVSVTPEKATVEYAITINMGGQSHESKHTQEIPAKVEKGHENIPPDMKGSTKDAGTEKVEIAGKSYDCKVIEFEGESAQAKSNGKMWLTTDIPGGLAKMESHMQGPREATIKMMVTAVDAKS